MKNPLDIIVSRFRNYHNPSDPEDVNLLEWLFSDEFRPQIEELRALEDKASRDDIKRTLPGVTVSGRFSRRNNSSMIEHSGLICLDIDGKENPRISDFNELKKKLSKAQNVAYCGLSASGRGLYCIVPIAYPEKHGQHFDALRNVFFSKWGVTLDKNCREVSRLRGTSWDDDPYINPQAVPYTGLYSPPIIQRQRTPFATNSNTANEVQRLVDEICLQGIDITGNYEQWLMLGFALANELGEVGRDFFNDISQFAPTYNAKECDRQYSACLKSRGSGVTIKTFFGRCRDYGVTLKESL